MKKIILSMVMVMVAFGVMAQQRQGRVDTRKLTGVANNIQDEFDRDNRIVTLEATLQPVFIITNIWEGQYLVAPTNPATSAAFTIALPNPTNNIGRSFRFITGGNSQYVLSNAFGMGGGNGFRDATTYGVSNVVWKVNSNTVAILYSTGTNYIVKVQ